MSALNASPWFAMAVAAGLSALALGALSYGRAHLPHDHPVDRSLHRRPVLRVGGIAIWIGFVPVALALHDRFEAGAIWLAAWAAVTAVSIADDWRGVRPVVRLAVHAAAALAISLAVFRSDALGGFSPGEGIIVTLAALAIVWSANLFNFMDGSDGLAALMAACGFGAYGAAALHAGESADLYLALAAATLPFLVANLPPARVFMGDGGSVPLGFLAAAFGLAGIREHLWPSWFPLLVFLPFIADTLLTMIRRMIARENLFRAHKTHYYQRLHRMGAGHVGTLLFYGVLVAGTSASAYVALATDPAAGWPVLGAWTVAIGGFFAGIDYHWRRCSPGQR
ncbi:MAG TPA: glycosyl transferase [Casimicrobiaceae bacterium]|nr:glycosyl transferase [Casimicrobiaceae bacterium]